MVDFILRFACLSLILYFYHLDIIDMRSIELLCHFSEYDNLSDLPEEDQNLIRQAMLSVQNAYAPYSKFNVGAAVLLQNGKVVLGNNQENASYPLGLCAERVALFAASANHPGETIKAIAITARSGNLQINKPVTPCGACRQVMAEYEHKQKQPIRILMMGEQGKILIADGIEHFLPMQFTSDDLTAKS
jgi:cytidine deaminase